VQIAIDAIWGMVTVGIILGGNLSGIFTPTEAGAVAVVYAFFVTMFIYRDVKWSELPKLIGRVVRTVGMVMIMIGFSIAFGYMMAILRIPAKATEFFIAISSDKYMFLLWINILLLALGTFMDLAPMLLICTPIFLPVIQAFGIDPVHFGIIMILNLGIGLLTPPVGPTMVVGCAIGKVSMEAVSRSILVFYIPMLIVLGLVTYIPALTLWLPSVLLKWEECRHRASRRCAAGSSGPASPPTCTTRASGASTAPTSTSSASTRRQRPMPSASPTGTACACSPRSMPCWTRCRSCTCAPARPRTRAWPWPRLPAACTPSSRSR
jgi:hypothetical protein